MKASLSKIKKQAQRGFTLVEIAIVLVIIGLIIGGVLRGQELIDSARVRSLVTQQSSIQTAYYGFVDRYKAIPGDLNAAQAATVNAATAYNSTTANQGDGVVLASESALFFNNISQAGYLSCAQCMATGTGTATNTTNNNPVNAFGGALWFSSNPGAPGGITAGYQFASPASEAGRPMVSTGNGVSSRILAELDRKIDDGDPIRGTTRYSDNVGGNGGTTGTPLLGCAGGSPAAGGTAPVTLAAASTTGMWAINPAGANCQAVTMF